ncbi:MAG TPA: threonine--tRNA ligase [Alphaproteobacteria bacterium]|mgnify:CR=1 FL=1|nr:threonine--tRNA ligase [Alphaproteobacteria bacterium]
MVNITLPDGSVKSFDAAVSGFDVAMSISENLARATYAMKLNGTQTDLHTTITTDSTVELITKNSEEGLEIMRHTVAAQVLAKAIKNLYPSAKLVIGPTIDRGFYYDIDMEEKISTEDFAKIEAEMKKVVKEKTKIRVKQVSRQDAIAVFEERNEDHKVEILKNADASQELFNLYYQGEDDDAFVDLCRGPHLPDLGKVGVFKLTAVSGAYLGGDSQNKQLQRVYGTAFLDKKAMQAYLTMMEEAEKRDHRKISKAMDLLHFEPEYAPGAVFWHDKGYKMYRALIEYMRSRQEENGYEEISTPAVMNRVLWETSGHWQKYGEHNYSGQTEDGKTFCIKPMNCPGGILVFGQGIKSYKDLPLRIAEFGKVHRYEASGALSGLMRVREFTQDDAHIYCTPDQMEAECISTLKLVLDIYKEFGFGDVKIYLSTRPEERIGSDDIWDLCEKSLATALENNGYEFEFQEGEGAFYGPKLEFILTDAIGREWQCGTIQVDMFLPERFDVSYIDDNNEKQRPVMLHRALFGSIERFMGILIEHFAGNFPLWLAPTQIALTGIVDKHNDAVLDLEARLKAEGFRVIADTRNEKVNYKIREHSHNKVSVIGVLGDKEIEEGKITVRRLGSNDQTVMDLEDFIFSLKEEVATRALPPFKS